MINLKDIDNKEYIIKEFFEWLFDDTRIIDKNIELQNEIDLSLAPFYMDPNIYYPKQISAFFESQPMQRLGRISQLSLAINTFPNTYHNRLDHSKGTYNRKLEEMILNFENPQWKKYIEENNLKLYLIGDLFKMAGHDIGHFPLSHAFEEEIYHNHDAHEIIGQKIMLENKELQNIFNNISPSLPDIMKELYKKDILNFTIHDTGNYDVDRLDYLSRDSLYLGIPQELHTLPYKTISVKTDFLNNPLLSEDFSIIQSDAGNSFIDVYDYSSLEPIENLLELRYSLYPNCYMSKSTKASECAIGTFLKALLSTSSTYGKDLKDFISKIQCVHIEDTDLSEFLKWDDIKLYEQIIEIAEKHEDANIRDLATMVIPNMESFLNMLYSHLNLHNSAEISDKDLAFLKKIKHIIRSNSEFSKNLRNPNFILENTLFNETNCLIPNNDIFCTFSYRLRGYSKKSPIYVENKDGQIYELSKHPERKCDWDEKSTQLQVQCTYLPFLRFSGMSETYIDKLKKEFSTKDYPDLETVANYPIKLNMQPLQVGHNIEDTFLEL